jgi:hypothetical protein
LTEEIKGIARTLNAEMGFRGAWFFQVKRDKVGNYKLLEFAPRIASTMGLFRQSGINFALLSLFDAMEIDVEVLVNQPKVELDRCLANRYRLELAYDRVYIDFDDTIIIDGRVNALAMVFLYQCRLLGKRVILLTKHKFDIRKSLHEFFIHPGLFEEINQIGENDAKVNYIEPEGAIFIDNYFFDRLEVSTKLGIPVFDVDAIECLLNSQQTAF